VIAASFIGKQRPRIARQEARTRVLRVPAYPQGILRAELLSHPIPKFLRRRCHDRVHRRQPPRHPPSPRETRFIEKADAVLAEMRAGAALHLQHTKQGPCWALSNGRQVSIEIAEFVTTSASVIDCGGSLFDGLPGQVWRWWRGT
jgi:hypothetical protein